jgi:NodT family efflux transporter outer membrane factor (OMF) lipoprotein
MYLKTLIALPIIIILPSCIMVGPKFKKPNIVVPKKYAQDSLDGTIKSLENWWHLFEDPCLSQLIQKAVCANYDLRIAVEKIEELRAEFGIKRAEMFPQVFMLGITQREKFSTNTPIYNNVEPNPLNNFNYFFEAVWELDLWGRLRRGKNAACFELQAEIEHMRDVYIILLADVATTYIDIKALQQKIAIREQQLALDEKIVSLQEELFTAGIESNIPYQDRYIQLQESKNILLMLETVYTQAHYALAVLLGENPSCFDLAPGELKIPQADQLIRTGLPSELLQRRPDIRRAERLLAVANQEVGIAVSDYFPRFFMLGGTGLQSNKVSTLFKSGSIGWSFGPAFFWPVITFGRIKFNIQVKESIERQAALSYAQTILYAFKDVEDALIQFFNASEQLNVLEKKLQAATQKKELIHTLFNAGLTNELEYLQIEKEYLEVAWNLADTKQKVSVALVVVYKSLGGGW